MASWNRSMVACATSARTSTYSPRGCSEMDHQGMADGYNTVRPHGSLGDMTPAEFTNRPSHGRKDTQANLSAA